jgi:hypothetical protein
VAHRQITDLDWCSIMPNFAASQLSRPASGKRLAVAGCHADGPVREGSNADRADLAVLIDHR